MTTLLVVIGEEPRSKTLMISFIVVRLPSTYNTIIGRSTLNKLRDVRENLDPLEEKRTKAYLRTLDYKRGVARLYNYKVCPRQVASDDLVLRKAEISWPKHHSTPCRRVSSFELPRPARPSAYHYRPGSRLLTVRLQLLDARLLPPALDHHWTSAPLSPTKTRQFDDP
ncbi:hypothetical protein B296_00012515 [Ensete ventricosum]|uniref:Uncharacterized protein n=1 Tax=Ensete ventricosum TaxID=4639 RepID=A0A426ZWK4_ENSVE|nr:hypothetical protein B296_00012515 [Ensete ventricosum]